MAKKSKIALEKVRISMSTSKFKVRQELKSIITSETATYEEKLAAVNKLNKRKRNESIVRVQRRCSQPDCGRPRAVYRQFKLCRIHLREAVHRGDVPGVVKDSW